MKEEAALLVLDVQKGMDDVCWGTRNNPEAEANIALLLARWRDTGRPVIHVHHHSVVPNSPLQEGLPGTEVKKEARPLETEKQFIKSVNSAFIGTKLEHYLRKQGISTLVVVGLTTDHCVSTTVRMAANLGFGVTLVSDATATFERQGPDSALYSAEDVHTINLVSLHKEFCTVRSTMDLLQ